MSASQATEASPDRIVEMHTTTGVRRASFPGECPGLRPPLTDACQLPGPFTTVPTPIRAVAARHKGSRSSNGGQSRNPSFFEHVVFLQQLTPPTAALQMRRSAESRIMLDQERTWRAFA